MKYEAEVTVPALLDALARGERPKGTHRGLSPASLDALPLPAWDLVDLAAADRFHESVVRDLGRAGWAFPIDGRTLPLVTSRGCPFRCVHCSSNPDREPGGPKTQRRLSEGRLRDSSDPLVHTHRATRLEILDELVNVNERHFDALLSTWHRFLPTSASTSRTACAPTTSSRAASRDARTGDDPQRERRERGSACRHRLVGKKLDLAAVVAAAERAHAAGVPLMIHFMIGLPGEMAEEVNGTLAFALDL